jgi:hypothetical protein
MKAFLFLLLCLCLETFTVPTHAAEQRPNILFAIADDWGAHASAYGTKWIATPAFDRVARDIPPHSPIAVRVLTVSGAAGAKANSLQSPARPA